MLLTLVVFALVAGPAGGEDEKLPPLFEDLPKAREADYYDLRIYIYDLPKSFHADIHSKVQKMATEHQKCDWMLTPCTETGHDRRWSTNRQLGQEVILLRKLLAAPFRTKDPMEADLFVVPALIGTACMGGTYDTHCPTPLLEFGDDLFSQLPFYNAETRQRHLFLASLDKRNLPLDIQAQTLLLSMGASWGDHPGHLVVPSSVTDVELQPGATPAIMTRDRPQLIFSAMVLNNPIRVEIHRQLEGLQGSQVILHTLQRSKDGLKSASWIAGQMLNSTFCVCAPAENTAAGTKRFYDALLSGCIPVVITFPTIWGSGVSWWRVDGAPIEWSLPFPWHIDWHRLVVEVSIDRLLEGQNALLHAALRCDVKEKQRYLSSVRDLLAYDMTGGHRDAFSLVMEGIHRVLPRLHKAAIHPRPLVCEQIPLWQYKGRVEGEKGWSSSYGELACTPMEFWHRCSEYWTEHTLLNASVSVKPLLVTSWRRTRDAFTSQGREVLLYTVVEEEIRRGNEYTLFQDRWKRPFMTCWNPEFPAARHNLRSSLDQAFYRDHTTCHLPAMDDGHREHVRPALPSLPRWQLVFGVCNTMAWENTLDVASIVEDLWVLPDDFQIIAFDVCSKAPADGMGTALLEHVLTLKMQQEQGEEIPEVLVFFAGMNPQEVVLQFDILTLLQQYDVVKDNNTEWMIAIDGLRPPGQICYGYLGTFRSVCPTVEHGMLNGLSPQALAFNTKILKEVPEVHLHMLASTKLFSFHQQIDYLTLLLFTAMRTSWREGRAQIIADTTFRQQDKSDCLLSFEQDDYLYKTHSGFFLQSGNQVLRLQALGCLDANGTYSIVDTGFPRALFIDDLPWNSQEDVKVQMLKNVYGTVWEQRSREEDASGGDPIDRMPPEEMGVFSLCHSPQCSAEDIIALGWQYLALYILGTESLGRNWARDHFPAPPPNAKIRATMQDVPKVSEVLSLSAPEQFHLWQQEVGFKDNPAPATT